MIRLASIRLLLAALCVLLACAPQQAAAHEVRPAVLELIEIDRDVFEASWKIPALEDRVLALAPSFAQRCQGGKDIYPRISGGSAVAHFRLVCRGGLAGTVIAVPDLPRVMTDVIVRIEFANGQVVNQRLAPNAPGFTVPSQTSAWDVFRTYLKLGIEHILLGVDHLLFVFALVLLVGKPRRILITATAFTLAHSITLSLVALGLVHVPIPPVEALIALSIVYLALELRNGAGGGDQPISRPWVLAFGFGLLHGVGFASALAEIGLPNHEIPAALFAFNVGVEIGQIVFIAAVLGAGQVIFRLWPARRELVYRVSTYCVGGLAAFWFIQRLGAFLPRA